jgi:CCR4-NOT transcriptional complex subunit CAF120
LFKVIGHISGEMVVVEGRQRLSGWIMIMPERLEVDTHSPDDVSPLVLDMLRWCVGIHDAFGLYGRPERYNWNPRDPTSLFFGYPEVASSEVS